MKAIDLFSGIGGFRKALQIADPEAEIVFSCEIDDKACEVYIKNFGENPKGDITEMNVKNLESHDNGKTFEIIKSTLRSLGYTIYWKVLDARHFGLPQKRKRIFIVGFLDKLHFSFPVGDPKARPKTKDILEDNVPDKYTLMDSTWGWLKKHREKHEKLGHGFGYQMVDINKAAFTVVAHYRKDPHTNLIPQDGKNPRKFTPREFARLQGFPDDFHIHPTNGHAYRQIGNSIPIPVVVELLKQIKHSLDTKKKKIDIDSFLTHIKKN